MTETAATEQPRLRHFPVAFFAMVMGLTGLTLAWRKAETLLDLPVAASPALLMLSTGLFALLAAVYVAKLIRFGAAARQEWLHPIKMNFVPAVSISLILLAIAWHPVSAPYSRLLWLAGTALHLVLTLHAVSHWMQHGKLEIVHLNPAWFIPVVGNILVPIVGVHHAPIEISWFFFSIGLMFWPVLLTIVFYRVVFHGSLPERLVPTLFILIAPPAVGFIAYLSLTGAVDAFAHVLYHAALFFTLLLFAQARRFLGLRFFLSWWAYSFPLAAITLASLAMFQETGAVFFLRLSGILLGIASVVIAGLLARTALAAWRGQICVAD
jgi:tellurite resistance protein